MQNHKSDFQRVTVLDERRVHPPAWEKINPGEMPPMLFEMRFLSGQIVIFPYSDIREIELRDPSHMMLAIYGMAKYHVTIEGRNLDELATAFRRCKINWLAERDQRAPEPPEDAGMIDTIRIETLTE